MEREDQQTGNRSRHKNPTLPRAIARNLKLNQLGEGNEIGEGNAKRGCQNMTGKVGGSQRETEKRRERERWKTFTLGQAKAFRGKTPGFSPLASPACIVKLRGVGAQNSPLLVPSQFPPNPLLLC